MKPKKVINRRLLLRQFVLALMLTISIFGFESYSQNTGIGINTIGAAANPAAIVDISSTIQGMLVPRMSTVQRNNIASPPESLLIYNTDSHCFEAYYNGGWVPFGCLASGCPVPSQPSAITGTGAVCQNQSGVSFSVTNVAGVSYTWTYSGTGFSIGSGSGTNSISANFSASATSGTLTVTCSNVCGSSLASTLSITVTTNPTATITSAQTICSGTNTTLTLGGGTSYTWAAAGSGVSGGAGCSSLCGIGPISQTLTGSGTVTYTLTATNAGCTGTASSIVTVNPSPSAPSSGTGTAGQTSIAWTWSAVGGATSYQWNTTNTYPGAGIDVVTSPSYTQSGLSCGTAYSLYVWAENATCNSSSVTLTGTTSACGCGGLTTMTDARGCIYGGVTYSVCTYTIVTIGTQCWMSQNLNYGTYTAAHLSPQLAGEKYCGTIKGISGASSNNTEDANCYNGGLYEWANMMNVDVNIYGATFSTYYGTANETCAPCGPTTGHGGVKGLCPAGWHIPTNNEFTTLTGYLSANSYYWCGSNSTYTAATLASQTGWTTYTGGNNCEPGYNQATNNSSGFNAFPNGSFRYVDATFQYAGSNGYWWSALESSLSGGYNMKLYFRDATVTQNGLNKSFGHSVRCVKDS